MLQLHQLLLDLQLFNRTIMGKQIIGRVCPLMHQFALHLLCMSLSLNMRLSLSLNMALCLNLHILRLQPLDLEPHRLNLYLELCVFIFDHPTHFTLLFQLVLLFN
jgi:hypothetical protein